MTARKLISIVIPVYNEEAGIPELIKRLKKFINGFSKYNFEIILVEHGSADRSFQLLNAAARKDRRFKVLQLSRNFSCDGGIAAGLHFISGDACVIMMADLQEPIKLIKDFISKWEKGYEIVYGLVVKRTANWWRNFNSRMFYKVINLFTNNMFPENASDFRLIDKKVYQAINQMEEQDKYLRGLIMWTGFKHIGIPFNRRQRFAGRAKSNFRVVINVAFNGILSFSYLPLRLISVLGIITTTTSFLLALFYLVHYFIYGRSAPGVATIILMLLFLFGILFFSLGVISEYLLRVYNEVKRRPQYIVKNKVNLK